MRRSVKVTVPTVNLWGYKPTQYTMAVKYYAKPDVLYCSGCSTELTKVELTKKGCIICHSILLHPEDINISLYQNKMADVEAFETNPCLDII